MGRILCLRVREVRFAHSLLTFLSACTNAQAGVCAPCQVPPQEKHYNVLEAMNTIRLRDCTGMPLPPCRSLGYVLIQSESLNTIKLHKCGKLNKVCGWGSLARQLYCQS